MHVCRRLTAQSRVLNVVKMSSADGDRLQQASSLLEKLQNELVELKKMKTEQRIKALTKENEDLRCQVNEALKELIRLEMMHGKKQIPIPNQASTTPEQINNLKNSILKNDGNNKLTAPSESKAPQANKEAKQKKPKAEKPQVDTTAEGHIDVGRLDFRVGKIVEVSRHPDADSLYLEKIDCGEPNPRTVVSGLVNHIPIEQMRDRTVVLLCNLKPVKMRGVTSEAMVMCASTPEKVEILTPPPGSVPGDLVHCEGYPRNPDALLNPKKKIFETCAPDLLTNSKKEACYKNAPLIIPGKGNIVSQTLVGVNIR